MEKNKRKALENELLSKLNLDTLPSGGYLTSDKAITYLFEDKKEGFFWGKTSYFDNYVAIDFFDFIGSNKEVIIDFAIEHPEVSYDLLYWLAMTKICKPKDFKQYSKEQIHQIPRVMREVIVNPADKYKLHIAQVVTDETLYYSITEENMWQALEWVAVNYPDKLNTFVGKGTSANPYSRKIVLEHYKNLENKTQLPEALQKFLIVLQKQHDAQVERQRVQAEKRRQQAREKLVNWYDESGKLLKLFDLKDGLEIKTLDDYKLILSYFISADLSVTEFCRHYQIEGVEGFKLMCKKFAAMDSEFDAFYTELTARKQREFIDAARKDIALGSESVEGAASVIHKPHASITLPTLVTLGESTMQPQEINLFARNVIDFYHTRLNSYTPTSSAEEDILKRLTEREVRFLISTNAYQRLGKNKEINLATEFETALKPVRPYLGRVAQQQLNTPVHGVKPLITPYSQTFNPSTVLDGRMQIIMPDETLKTVDTQMIDMAETYAHSHKLFRAPTTMSRIIKAVAVGAIQNQAETDAYKAELEARAAKTAHECTSVEGYLKHYAEYGE